MRGFDMIWPWRRGLLHPALLIQQESHFILRVSGNSRILSENGFWIFANEFAVVRSRPTKCWNIFITTSTFHLMGPIWMCFPLSKRCKPHISPRKRWVWHWDSPALQRRHHPASPHCCRTIAKWLMSGSKPGPWPEISQICQFTFQAVDDLAHVVWDVHPGEIWIHCGFKMFESWCPPSIVYPMSE